MKINFVNPYNSFAMRQCIDPLLEDPNRPAWIEYADSTEPNWAADLNYFIPGHIGEPVQGKSIMLYTHTNPGTEDALRFATSQCEYTVCMSDAGAMELGRLTDAKHYGVIPIPINPIFKPKKPAILIVGTEQPNGRKRSWILLELMWKIDLTRFNFVIVGTGWDYVVDKMRVNGIEVTMYKNASERLLASLYQNSDALLVTGFIEGGPLPLVEALASGLLVIAPEVGYAKDYADYIWTYGTINHLATILSSWKIQADLSKHTARSYCDSHYQLFQSLGDIPVRSRYDHLTKTIRENNIHSIMEIGTGRGDNAVKMISAAMEHVAPKDVLYIGFDLFRELSQEEMIREKSKQPDDYTTVLHRLQATGANVLLYKGDSSEQMNNMHYSGGAMDLIYIDGGHAWKTILNDWNAAQAFADKNTTFIFDDFYTGEVGETGCQKMVNVLYGSGEYNVDVLEPQEHWPQPDGSILHINMAKVTHK